MAQKFTDLKGELAEKEASRKGLSLEMKSPDKVLNIPPDVDVRQDGKERKALDLSLQATTASNASPFKDQSDVEHTYESPREESSIEKRSVYSKSYSSYEQLDFKSKKDEEESLIDDPLEKYDEDPAGEFFECESDRLDQCPFDIQKGTPRKCRLNVPDRNSDLLCFPIDHYDDVVKWVRPSSDWSKLVKPLRKRTSFCAKGHPPCRSAVVNLCSSGVSKTLVCHDMKGGYLNDRFIKGHQSLDDYKFVYWANIDIFVYFSHHFLTIPPLAWINAGHLHGVKVLGTLITEGKCGAVAWHDICRSKHLVRQLAFKLCLICKHYGFDGYLINIENELCIHHSKKPFVYFMKRLYAQLKRISADHLLIWYDAVTNDGHLTWQNCLNDKNSEFFELCDGIYLNYTWDEPLLEKSVLFAGDRKFDVYVGIDVFGRGTFGGGGFSTHEALKVVRKYNLSAAIFAPGWVHENCPEDMKVDARDFYFWQSLSQFLYCYGPCELPFETSFCRGYGHKLYKDGLVISEEPWFDQSKMSYVPSQLSGVHEIEENSCFVYYDRDGFCGGGCLLYTQKSHKHLVDQKDCLLICDFSRELDFKTCIELYTKPLDQNEKCEMDLVITTVNLDNIEKIECMPKIEEMSYTFPLRNDEESMINTWQKNTFKISLGHSEHIINICCGLTGKCKPLLLGYLKIYSCKD